MYLNMESLKMVQEKPPIFVLNISPSETGRKERSIVVRGRMGREPAKVAAVLKKLLLCIRWFCIPFKTNKKILQLKVRRFLPGG
jgi:hypothetical protein